MNILFFDTETTGVPRNYKAPVTDLNNWPRLVQLGYIYMDQFNPEKVFHERIVKPVGFEISESVSKIHGITQEYALEHGLFLDDVLREFNAWLTNSSIIVGHNLSYDLNVLGAEYLRCFGSNPLTGIPTYDTMLVGTDLCKIPGSYGKFKWPKLHELYQFLFNKPLEQSHTALDDIQHTAECYFEMRSRGL